MTPIRGDVLVAPFGSVGGTQLVVVERMHTRRPDVVMCRAFRAQSGRLTRARPYPIEVLRVVGADDKRLSRVRALLAKEVREVWS